MFSAAGKTAAVATAANYIEDVFSTWLYTGDGSTQTITNGIDLAGKGGLVWMKGRNNSTDRSHNLVDTARGSNKSLFTNLTNAEATATDRITSFNSNGFGLGSSFVTNENTFNYVSWTFRKQPKFFDVVTYTGTGTASLVVNHSLGSKPGFIAVKRTDSTGNWWCWARASNTEVVTSGGAGTPFALNSTNAGSLTSDSLIVGAADATTFTPYFLTGFSNSTDINGATYVAYLFAHNAGGFGLTGTDNVISCGSFTTDSGGVASVTLGYEPQWVMTKNSSGTSAWRMFDTMRGLTVAGQNDALLQANSSAAEITNSDYCSPTATGFEIAGHSGSATHIYIAIRRGPMKTPTTGTSVFSPVSQAGGGTVTTNFVVDGVISKQANNALAKPTWFDRLRGSSATSSAQLFSSDTSAETDPGVGLNLANNTGYVDSAFGAVAGRIYWNLQRAPGFFDVVCWTGTTSEGTPITVSHNLNAVPELIITKKRSQAAGWFTYHAALTAANYVSLDSSNASAAYSNMWNNTTPTSTVFTTAYQNASGDTYVAYLFASCPGVSKVFSFTGNGSSQTINCGFTGGSRLVLIKRTDSTGNWVIFDSARGIVSGNDPALYLNSTAAEVTGVDAIDTDSTGFIVNQETTFNLNVNNATYIGLAIS